ncbi:MAG: calcium-binding protein [Pseudomonadota bacterium]
MRKFRETGSRKNDLLEGKSSQSNILDGKGGNDVLSGGRKNDILKGGGGDDRLNGFAGADELDGGRGDDVIRAGAGSDVIAGGKGRDELFGQGGDDRVFGGAGVDVLGGGKGDDDLTGGAGDDRVFGGAGNDDIRSGKGRDVVVGGAGSDRFIFKVSESADGADEVVIRDFEPENDILLAFSSINRSTNSRQFDVNSLVVTEVSGGVRVQIFDDLNDNGVEADGSFLLRGVSLEDVQDNADQIFGPFVSAVFF